MSSLISLIRCGFSRLVARNLHKYVDKNNEVSTQILRLGASTICKYSTKPQRELILKPVKSVCCRSDRYFRISALVLQSETVTCPPFPESVTEGDVRLEKKVGDAVAQDEVVMEIETDKTSMPVHSPNHGIIEEILVKDGDTVKAGTPLFKLKVTGEAPKKTEAAPAKEVPKAAPAPQPSAPIPPPAPPPAAPKPAAAAPAPPPKPASPMTSIPVAAIRHAQSLEATATVKLPPSDPTKEITGTRTEQRVKMNRMRLKIAQRLKEAQNVNAMLTTFNEIDMTNIIEFRKQHQEAFQKKYGIKLGFMSAFLKASAYALQDQPVVNAVIDGNEIVYRDYVDISVAVATPKGLVVPVVRNVENMNFADIELALAALGEKARKGQIAIEDMDGGTFTVSNGGVFGSLMGTPIINPPQSAILGMHATFERPVALKGQVVIRPMMYIALTYDHRLIDGREAVLFLRKIKQGVEDPRTMIAGL
ncbi:dihydrolipoyllysine-residue succinyltransferase component of 2-oxoglutarate dehydrogenase complex, mitochondrial isoform X2 [Cylas formicarius]|uniref:dihydrolipoyllysine-residue succinyltransferase component of 2-oxoglutarate dehydrogenase complex, mitochondrial isoform X2 n=1 Tax=Cylas formicarius TaxID=197179 RepID=UPI0029583B35|nr:dihydrolipoyllysine-residue succinyltransferase component of 2-oxoglutarate dehydrogenase complex, mitochondrial isoform X2 [Cylas formicarius]